jgi:hypothetical protein
MELKIMSRRSGRALHRYNPQAQKEKRDMKVIKAYRMLDGGQSAALSGIMHELENEQEVPPLKAPIPSVHTIFVLDPHNVREQFTMGFNSGFRFEAGRARNKLKASQEKDDYKTKDIIHARIGEIATLRMKYSHSNNLHLVARIESEELLTERKDIYRILGEEGLTGFSKLSHKGIVAPYIHLGITQNVVSDPDDQAKIAEAIETAILIHDAMDISLGPLQIV